MGSLKVTPSLHCLLQRTSEHVRLPVSDVIRITLRGIVNGRPVVHFPVKDIYYKHPNMALRVREFDLPDWIEPEEFRRLLAMRCMEELRKGMREQKPHPEIEGIDYIVEDQAE